MESKKAWTVEFPSDYFGTGSEIQVVFAETRNKAKYIVLGEGDSTWINMKVLRAKSLDGLEEKFENDSRFRDLWYLNNGFVIELWTLPNGEKGYLNEYEGMTTLDDIKDYEGLPNDTEITYELLDQIALRYKEKSNETN